MSIEKRLVGKSAKYYHVHSYRDKDNTVQKIRTFLGTNLSKEALEKAKIDKESIILFKIDKITTKIFECRVTPRELRTLNNFSKKIPRSRFQPTNWIKFTEEFAYNTNAIAGSMILRKDIHNILAKHELKNDEEIETKRVAKAVEFVRTTKQELSLEFIRKLHMLCFKETNPEAGEFRKVDDIGIRDSKGNIVHIGIEKKNLNKELIGLISWYNIVKDKFTPLLLAAIIHNQFEKIHPFQDGNGRVGRLLLNYILIKNYYPPVDILLENKEEYYFALQKYSTDKTLIHTLKFLITQYKKMSR